ncbi:MAG: 30S ribosomal protein S20 [Oscillospiraceae bacterium]|nr:30S ribosomal protein S20 [Oscillospiraceae bacterium]
MPNIKSAKKRVLVSRTRTEANKAAKSTLRTAIKKARAEGADAAVVKAAVVTVDKAAGKGLIHKNKAARLKSQLAKKANATA